eukprot:2828844-Amphidinium_carterae.1
MSEKRLVFGSCSCCQLGATFVQFCCQDSLCLEAEDISVNAEHLGKLVQTIYEQLTSTSTKDTAAIDAALKADMSNSLYAPSLQDAM